LAILDERYGKNTMKCTFDFIYKNIHRKLCYFPPHEHDYYEVVYFFKGTGIVEIDGREFEYGPNTFSIVKPFSLRSERHHTLTSNWCTGFFINENLFNVENGLYSDTKGKKILSTILAIRNEFTEKRQNYNEMMDILSERIVILVQRMQSTNNENYDKFVKVIQFIEENFDKDIDLEQMAEMTNYSYHHFRHTFKKITGFSPTNYIIHKRVEQAKRLLSDGSYTVSYISQICGFSTDAQFNQLFKKITGMTPGKYKKIYSTFSRRKMEIHGK